jgi:hypothetical protein
MLDVGIWNFFSASLSVEIPLTLRMAYPHDARSLRLG